MKYNKIVSQQTLSTLVQHDYEQHQFINLNSE